MSVQMQVWWGVMSGFLCGVIVTVLAAPSCPRAEIEWYGDHSKVPDVQEQDQRGQDRDTQDMFNQRLRESLEHRQPC